MIHPISRTMKVPPYGITYYLGTLEPIQVKAHLTSQKQDFFFLNIKLKKTQPFNTSCRKTVQREDGNTMCQSLTVYQLKTNKKTYLIA